MEEVSHSFSFSTALLRSALSCGANTTRAVLCVHVCVHACVCVCVCVCVRLHARVRNGDGGGDVRQYVICVRGGA